MPHQVAVDPLGDSADPRRYVPVDTDESALRALEASVREGRSPVLLEGPCGVGKTLLLRVLAERALRSGHQVVFSPFLHVAPDDVARWLLHLLGQATAAEALPDTALLAFAHARGGDALLLIVDEIQSAPEGSVRRLAELARAGANVGVVVGGTPGSALRALLQALGPRSTVSLPDALPRREIEAICDELIRQPALDPALRASLWAARDAVVTAAHGLPVSLKAELVRCALGFALGTAPRPRAWEDDDVAADPPGAAGSGAPESAAAHGSCDPVPPAVAPIASARPRWAPRRIRADVLAAARACATKVRVVAGRAASRAGDVVGHVHATGREIVLYGGALVRPRWAPRRIRADVLAAARACATKVRVVVGRAASRAGDMVGHVRATGREIVLYASALVRAAAMRAAASADEAAAKVRAGAGLVSEEIARAGRGLAEAWAPRAPRRATLLAAAALVALAVAASWNLRSPLPGPAPVATGAPPAPAVSAAPVPVASVRLHVNARPWARIRVDGVDVGPTPLSHLHVEPGPHDFEAVFPDGRVVRRRVEVGPDQRFVTFR